MRRIQPSYLIVACLALLVTVVAAPRCSSAQVRAGDPSLLTFGAGTVKVRLYSDYFCGACSRLEPSLEERLPDLVTKNRISLTFIDTPVHKHSPLYARYFLYALNEKKEIRKALAVRAALFEAAMEKIADQEGLEAFLKKKGIKFAPFDVRPVLIALDGYFREDKITSTPTAVIMSGGKKDVHAGIPAITEAFGALK